MKLLRIYILFFVFIVSSSVVAQKRDVEWLVGYFAPYLSNVGGTVGCTFDLKELGRDSKKQKLQLSTQLSYFAQADVSQNLLLNSELVYRWNKQNQRFFLTYSLGAGYLLSFQRQEGTLNLGTGEIDYRNETLHYFLPTLNMGLGVAPKKCLGFYTKATYGRKLSTQNANAAFLGITIGLILKIKT